MNYTIYKTTNTVNNKIYIGKHQTENINDSYLGSGISLERAINKYGKEYFIKEILYIFDNEEEMNSKEKELVSEEFIKRKDNYNESLGGEGGSNFKNYQYNKKVIQQTKDNAKKRETAKRNTNYSVPFQDGITYSQNKYVKLISEQGFELSVEGLDKSIIHNIFIESFK